MRIALVAALLAAVLAAGAGWLLYSNARSLHPQDQERMSELEQQLERLQSENTQLKENLAKSQSEEERLSAANQDLIKALSQARLTGKIPPLPPSALPYPPK